MVRFDVFAFWSTGFTVSFSNHSNTRASSLSLSLSLAAEANPNAYRHPKNPNNNSKYKHHNTNIKEGKAIRPILDGQTYITSLLGTNINRRAFHLFEGNIYSLLQTAHHPNSIPPLANSFPKKS